MLQGVPQGHRMDQARAWLASKRWLVPRLLRAMPCRRLRLVPDPRQIGWRRRGPKAQEVIYLQEAHGLALLKVGEQS